MITVVISTKEKNENYIKCVDNIKRTSGIKDLEIIGIENNSKYSLTEAYNIGLDQAKNDIILFAHDDIILESGCNWGNKILEHFKNSDYGILGKAGTVKFHESGKWWFDSAAMVGRVFHQQIHPQTGKIVRWLSEYSGNFGKNIVSTVMVDGLFFAVHKQRIKHHFDPQVKGFHFYEIDFCLKNFLDGVKIGVVSDFNITHKSIGQTNEQWEENRKIIAEKYKDKLPLSVPPELFYEEKTIKIKKQPFVSIIVPTKGNVELLTNLLNSISLHTAGNYKNFEVVIADTGSSEEEKERIKRHMALYNDSLINGFKTRLIEFEYYNFGKINNEVVREHLDKKTELILFCNNDIEFLNDCLSLMVDTYLKNHHTCGTVGARLHFEDNTIQHAGMFLLKQQNFITAGHVGYRTSYQYNSKVYQVVGNTAAMLLMSKVIFEKIGGFNESYLKCFEDVELNLQVLLRNYKNYFCGEAVAFHKESQTRDKQNDQKDFEKMNHFINANMEKLSKYILDPNAKK